MPQDSVISIQPHEKAIVAVVMKRALDSIAAGKVEAEVSAAAANTPGLPVVLDLSKVDFAPSVAIGALLRLMQDLKFFGRRLIVVGMNQKVRGAFAVTGVDKLFEIRPNVDDALVHLGSAR